MSASDHWTHCHITTWSTHESVGIYTDYEKAEIDAQWLMDQWIKSNPDHRVKRIDYVRKNDYAIVALYRTNWEDPHGMFWSYCVAVNPCAMDCDQDPEENNHLYGDPECACYHCNIPVI